MSTRESFKRSSDKHRQSEQPNREPYKYSNYNTRHVYSSSRNTPRDGVTSHPSPYYTTSYGRGDNLSGDRYRDVSPPRSRQEQPRRHTASNDYYDVSPISSPQQEDPRGDYFSSNHRNQPSYKPLRRYDSVCERGSSLEPPRLQHASTFADGTSPSLHRRGAVRGRRDERPERLTPRTHETWSDEYRAGLTRNARNRSNFGNDHFHGLSSWEHY